MASGKSINGNADGANNENQSYTVVGRGVVSRAKLVSEVRQNKHEGVSIYIRDNTPYVRANPDNSSRNNIDK